MSAKKILRRTRSVLLIVIIGLHTGCTSGYKADWYRIFAERGDAKAQNNLGICYRDGIGVSQNYTEAARWFRLSAEQGYAEAQYNLGVSYQTGTGVPQIWSEAAK